MSIVLQQYLAKNKKPDLESLDDLDEDLLEFPEEDEEFDEDDYSEEGLKEIFHDVRSFFSRYNTSLLQSKRNLREATFNYPLTTYKTIPSMSGKTFLKSIPEGWNSTVATTLEEINKNTEVVRSFALSANLMSTLIEKRLNKDSKGYADTVARINKEGIYAKLKTRLGNRWMSSTYLAPGLVGRGRKLSRSALANVASIYGDLLLGVAWTALFGTTGMSVRYSAIQWRNTEGDFGKKEFNDLHKALSETLKATEEYRDAYEKFVEDFRVGREEGGLFSLAEFQRENVNMRVALKSSAKLLQVQTEQLLKF